MHDGFDGEFPRPPPSSPLAAEGPPAERQSVLARLVLTALQLFSVELPVASRLRFLVNVNCQCDWLDTEQVQVEQGVQVGPEEQSVRGVVVVVATVRLDVRCFEDVQERAARDHAAVAVALPQGVAEGLLPPACLDLP